MQLNVFESSRPWARLGPGLVALVGPVPNWARLGPGPSWAQGPIEPRALLGLGPYSGGSLLGPWPLLVPWALLGPIQVLFGPWALFPILVLKTNTTNQLTP